jgi:hypothetical protein
MRSIYTNTILSIFLFFVLLSFLLLNNASSEVALDEKKKIYLYLYDVITVVFICILIFLILFKGYFYGVIDAIFIWAFFVIATPVPESGLLISLPLKRFFNLKMSYVQVFVSLLAIFLTFYLYKCHGSVVKATYIGRLFDEIVKSKYYIIIVLSIVSSILGSELIDNYIDMVVGESNKIENLQVKLIIMVLLLMTFMLLLNPLVKIK